MSRTSPRIAAAAAAALVLAIAAAPAGAGKAASSEVVIKKLSATGAKGKVRSDAAACKKRRKVVLLYVGDYTNVRAGKATTNRRGGWKLSASLEDGRYFAKVKKKGGKCKADESKTTRLRTASRA